jgi:hypothetical protein
MDSSRRSFVKKTAVVGSAALVVPTIIPSKVFGANERINAAVLGLNGRGKSHVKGLMVQDNVQVTTLCDPDMNILKKRQKEFKETYNGYRCGKHCLSQPLAFTFSHLGLPGR